MIIDLEQQRTGLDISYFFSRGNSTLCTAYAQQNMGKFKMELRYEGKPSQFLYFDPHSAGTIKDRMTFWLYQKDELIGSFVGATHKTGLIFGGYAYYKIRYNEKAYELYEIGLGNKGLFLSLYSGGTVCAVAEKNVTVTNYRDQYKLYIEKESDFYVFSAALLYYDVISYGDFLKINAHSSRTRFVYTKNEELIEKCDFGFIERVKSQEGV